MATSVDNPGAGSNPAHSAFREYLAQDDRIPDALRQRALMIAETLVELTDDPDVATAGALYPLLDAGAAKPDRLRKTFSADAMNLAVSATRLGRFGDEASWDADGELSPQQAEALRRMMLAAVEDVRLILIRLVDQLERLESAKSDIELRERLALETRAIYAPLASRLGIWQLKWQLEDYTFRFLEPGNYKAVASWLNERRTDRERYIKDLVTFIRDRLADDGIEADVRGRPKHIFSIWKKMERKQLDFEQLFDIRAVRVIVDSIADCYAALGIVHGLWRYIPGEFDDYIATPKENDYRSLHTAVIGPQGRTIEIQIRTRGMHDQAELGVAAHWHYKEGGRRDSSFEEKMNDLRQLLEPDENEAAQDFIERFRSEIFADRVYVLTPQGDVVDLPAGSTPLDFAYHVHTDLGHRCRGAKVNGRIVPLDHQLENGEKVEVISAKESSPSRDWLIPQHGYLASSRARAKVRAWFRKQSRDKNRDQGQALLEKELQRLGKMAPTPDALARELHLSGSGELFIALGAGDLTINDVIRALDHDDTEDETPAIKTREPRPATGGVAIAGVGNLLTQVATCCRPVPPERIGGYITRGRGVTIHRRDCSNFLNLVQQHQERIIEVSWGDTAGGLYEVTLLIQAVDRRGLLKDITSLLAAEKIDIVGMSSNTDSSTHTALINLTISVNGLETLSRIQHKLTTLSNIETVRRQA